MSNVLQNNLHSDPAIQRRSMSKEKKHEDFCFGETRVQSISKTLA